jgi:hypothetical protein
MNGTVKGILKVAKLTRDTLQGSNILTFENGHNFQVGDQIYSSYGLYHYNGDYNPVTVTQVNGNTVTVSDNATALLPTYSYVGTFQWLSLVKSIGKNNFIKGIEVTNSQGYGIELITNSARVEDVTINNVGFDVTRIADGVTAYLKNVTFGYSYEPAKQGVSTTNFADITLEECTFNRFTSDPEFYIFNSVNGTKIKCINCEFIGTQGSLSHQAPFNNKPTSVVSLSCNGGSVVDSIELIGCTFTDYSQGVVVRPPIIDYASNITVNKILVKECNYIRVHFGPVAYVVSPNYRIEDCFMDCQNVFNGDSQLVGTTSNCIVQLYRNNINNDGSGTILSYVYLEDNEFHNNAQYKFDQTSSGIRNYFDNTPISAFPMNEDNPQMRLYDTVIQYPNFSAVSAGSIVNIGYGQVFPFKLKNGTLKGYFVNNGTVSYILEMTMPAGTLKKGLYGDDYWLPYGSLVTILNGSSPTDRFKMVIKATHTSLVYGVSKGATNVALNNVDGYVVGDFINIMMNDNRIHTSTITNVNGTTITFSDALPNDANGGNVAANFQLG